MNTTHKGILALLKSGLTGVPTPLPEDFSLEDALPTIKVQRIAALACEGAIYCGISMLEPAMQHLLTYYDTLVRKHENQHQLISRIFQAFEENSITYMPLKGCLMKPRYPRPELRTMADADILIRMEQYAAIPPLLSELGLEMLVESDHELIWIAPGKLKLELHKRVIPSYNSDYYAYFGDGWQLASQQDGMCHIMKPEDEYIYLFTHFAKHYRDGEVQCHHAVDLWVFSQAYPQLNWDYVEKELQKLELARFHANTRRTLCVWFEDQADDPTTEQITSFILDPDHRRRLLSMEVRNQKTADASDAKHTALIRAIFPPVAELQYKYPILQKSPWTLPLIWVWRWITAVLFRRDNIQRRKDNLEMISQDSVQSYRQELQSVGLDFKTV